MIIIICVNYNTVCWQIQNNFGFFSGTIFSTSTLPVIIPALTLLAAVSPVILVLKLNESVALATLKSTIASSSYMAGIYLQYYHRLPDVFE